MKSTATQLRQSEGHLIKGTIIKRNLTEAAWERIARQNKSVLPPHLHSAHR